MKAAPFLEQRTGGNFPSADASSSARESGQNPLATLEDIPRSIRDIAALRGLGYTYSEIGHSLGVTAQAISVTLVRYRRKLASTRGSKHMMGLSTRALNVLSKHCISDPSDPRLSTMLEHFPGERNCGAKTIMEIQRWAGLDTDKATSWRSRARGRGSDLQQTETGRTPTTFSQHPTL